MTITIIIIIVAAVVIANVILNTTSRLYSGKLSARQRTAPFMVLRTYSVAA